MPRVGAPAHRVAAGAERAVDRRHHVIDCHAAPPLTPANPHVMTLRSSRARADSRQVLNEHFTRLRQMGDRRAELAVDLAPVVMHELETDVVGVAALRAEDHVFG